MERTLVFVDTNKVELLKTLQKKLGQNSNHTKTEI